VSKPKWGEKRECPECGARFYDLKRTPIVCPKCDTPFPVVVEKAPPPNDKPPPGALPSPVKGADGSKVVEAGDQAGDLADIEINDDDADDDADDLMDASVELDEDDDMSDELEGAIDETKAAE